MEKYKYKNKTLLFALFLFFNFTFLGFFTADVFAQQVGIRVSPLRIEELVEPGDVVTKSVKITNLSNSSQIFYAYLADFKGRGEGGEAMLIEPGSEEGPYLASWIEVSREGVIFGPGEEKQVSITFRVPEEAGPGGHYGAVIFGSQPPEIDPEEGAIIGLAHQAAILALFHVLGDVVEEARIREFTTDKNIYGTPFEVNFLSRIENLGNVHIKPVGSIEIKNMRGKERSVLSINSTGVNVLPKTIRRFESSWQEDLGFGRYKASIVLSFGTPTQYGGGGVQTIFAERSFWIIPWKIIIPVFLGLIFLATLLSLFIKFHKNKAVKKALQEAGLGQGRYVRKYQGPPLFLYSALAVVIVLILVILIIGAVFLLFFL